MNDHEPFLLAILASPADAKTRLDYANWLEDRDDPRGSYLRAELAWGETPSVQAEVRLRELARGLNAIWVARVSRPPLGVCCDHVRFVAALDNRDRPRVTLPDLDWLESRFQLQLPADYKAFLLNYNGGRPCPQYFRHDLIEQRFGIVLPAGYDGCRPDYCGNDPGPAYGHVGSFLTVWAAADTVPKNADASGDWSPDLVENLQLLEHWRTDETSFPADYWRQGLPANLIWIGYDGPTGEHEVYCLGFRGETTGRVYHTASHSDHSCQCADCVLIAPSFAEFIGLLVAPASQPWPS